jgi:hypothetical protein
MKKEIIFIILIIFLISLNQKIFASKSSDFIIDSGFSIVNFAGDNFTGGNVKLSLLGPVYHSQPDNLDIVLGGGIRIERVDYLTQEKYYGYATTINSFEVGIITGLRYKILPELRFYLLPSFYYSPHTIFENKIYLNNTDIIKEASVDYNINTGIDLKLIYKIFSDFGIGLDSYFAYGYMKYNDTSFYSLTVKGGQGGYFIYNFNVSFTYFLR